MATKKCNQCNQLFNNRKSPSNKLCSTCYEQERDKYRVVKDYLWDNPGSSVQEVAEETDISAKTIRRFIREDKFDF